MGVRRETAMMKRAEMAATARNTMAVLCMMSPRPAKGVTMAAKRHWMTLSMAEAEPASDRPSSMARELDDANTMPEPKSMGMMAIS